MAKTINEGSPCYAGLQARRDLVYNALPEDGSCISITAIRAILINNPVYNPNGDLEGTIHSKIAVNLEHFEKKGKAEKHTIAKRKVVWSREGGDSSALVRPVDAQYPPDSWEERVLVVIKNSSTPKSFDQIIDIILGDGSLLKPFDSEFDRDECEDGVHAAIFQLLEDKIIVQKIEQGIKLEIYSIS